MGEGISVGSIRRWREVTIAWVSAGDVLVVDCMQMESGDPGVERRQGGIE